MNISLFPLSEYWWFYLCFTGLVLVLLSLDLGLFHRKAHAVSFREASMWCVAWVTIAGLFTVVLWQYSDWKFHNDARLIAAGLDASKAARNVVLEFITGYVVELSLSVDNIFVFVLVFRYFAIPPQYQHRVLFYGILGALIFRGIFIAVGAALIRYHWVSIVFGVFLVITGVRLAFTGDEQIEPEKNPLLRLFARRVPVSPSMDGQNFWVQLNGRSHATPLLVAVIFMELTDIMFAIDSVPAIFAITREPLIVFTSNVFAILGLRSMYFLLAGAVEKFFLLKYGLALVLVFVGLKMAWLNSLFGGKFPIGISLAIILTVIGASIAASLLISSRRPPEPPADTP